MASSSPYSVSQAIHSLKDFDGLFALSRVCFTPWTEQLKFCTRCAHVLSATEAPANCTSCCSALCVH
eukprot:1156215-Pelagomonas_calceolata.AAC.7